MAAHPHQPSVPPKRRNNLTPGRQRHAVATGRVTPARSGRRPDEVREAAVRPSDSRQPLPAHPVVIQNECVVAEIPVAVDALAERLQRIRALTWQLEESREEVRALRESLTVALAEIDGLRAAMEHRAVIEQAKGMTMAALGVDADAAFQVLVERSQRSHTKLHEVAAGIVTDGQRRRQGN